MAAACGADDPPATGIPETTGPAVVTTDGIDPPTTLDIPDRLAAFEVREVGMGPEIWRVAVADSSDLRATGLMGVSDLGDLDGMLFVWAEDTGSGFWMKDTLIPLDIAFFSEEGLLVDVLSMVPCESDPCPSYRPAGEYRYAVEADPGRFPADPVLHIEP